MFTQGIAERGWSGLKIGFVWVCFPAFPDGIYFHNLLSNKTLRPFTRGQIGFVFSNCVFNPQKIWGLNNIGFVWL
jgi:hypothetical protein